MSTRNKRNRRSVAHANAALPLEAVSGRSTSQERPRRPSVEEMYKAGAPLPSADVSGRPGSQEHRDLHPVPTAETNEAAAYMPSGRPRSQEHSGSRSASIVEVNADTSPPDPERPGRRSLPSQSDADVRGRPGDTNGYHVTKSIELNPLETGKRKDMDDDTVDNPLRSVPHLAQERTKRAFGISRPMHTQRRGSRGYNIDSYEQKYPPDELFQEMGPNARVWRVYLDEADAFDTDMIEGWRDTIDVLLVFAGLFSAVVTTFVVQTTQALRPDYGQISASLLTELVSLQRTVALGESVDTVPPSPLNATSQFSAASTDRWVNGLWFSSLAFSLSTAAISVLVKQWLQHYISSMSGSAREQVHARQFRFNGLRDWHVQAIIGWLPVLMHLSLLIFFLGLLVFINPLDVAIFWVMIVIMNLSYVTYIVTNMLPLIYADCPYKTPLTHHMHLLFHFGTHVLEKFFYWAQVLLHRVQKMRYPQTTYSQKLPSYKSWNLKDQEGHIIKSLGCTLDLQSLSWLFSASSNPTVTDIVCQALSAVHGLEHLPKKHDLYTFLRYVGNQFEMHSNTLYNDHKIDEERLASIERLGRAFIMLKLYSCYKDNLDCNLQDVKVGLSTNASKTLGKIIRLGKDNDLQHVTIIGMLLNTLNLHYIENHTDEIVNSIDVLTEIIYAHILQEKPISSDHLYMIILVFLNVLNHNTSLHECLPKVNLSWRLIFMLYCLSIQEILKMPDLKRNKSWITIIYSLDLVLKKCKITTGQCILPIFDTFLEEIWVPDVYKLKILFLKVTSIIMPYFEERWVHDNPKDHAFTVLLFENINILLFEHKLEPSVPIWGNKYQGFWDTNEADSLLTNLNLVFLKLGNSLCYTFPSLSRKEQNSIISVLLKSYSRSQSKNLFSNLSHHENTKLMAYSLAFIGFQENDNSSPEIKALLSAMLTYITEAIMRWDVYILQVFVFQQGIQVLQNADLSLLQLDCYTEYRQKWCIIIIELFFHICSFSSGRINNDGPWASISKYVLTPHNLIWCFDMLIKMWYPKRNNSFLQHIHLVELCKMSDDHKTWLEITRSIIQRTRHIRYFNISVQAHYIADFIMIEELKEFLDINPEDKEFILHEYHVAYDPDKKKAEESYAKYPEVITEALDSEGSNSSILDTNLRGIWLSETHIPQYYPEVYGCIAFVHKTRHD